jgi:hypothetical protein
MAYPAGYWPQTLKCGQPHEAVTAGIQHVEQYILRAKGAD